MGAVYAPYLGTPKHNAVVLLIYIRLFCTAILQFIAAFFAIHNIFAVAQIAAIIAELYIPYAKNNTLCILSFVTRIFSSYLFAINFNSANLAELKIFHRRLPHTCVVGCGGLVVGLERNPPHIYERIFDCLLHLSVFVVSVVGFAGKVVHGKNKKIKLYKGFLFCRQTHHNPPHRSLRNI